MGKINGRIRRNRQYTQRPKRTDLYYIVADPGFLRSGASTPIQFIIQTKFSKKLHEHKKLHGGWGRGGGWRM